MIILLKFWKMIIGCEFSLERKQQKLSAVLRYLFNIFTGRQVLKLYSITDKLYILQKSWFQWICSKFFGLWHGHDYLWPSWLWRLLEAEKVIASAHFCTLTQHLVHPTVNFVAFLEKLNFTNSAYQRFTKKWDQL